MTRMQPLALEAVFVALLLFTAVAFTVSLDPPLGSQPTAHLRTHLELTASDVLKAMDATSDPDYNTKLTRFIVETLNHNSTALRKFLNRSVDTFTQFGLTLHTPTDRMVLWQDREPAGEFVGKSIFWTPVLDNAFIVPEFDAYDGDTMGMGATVIPLRNGFVVNDRDIGLEVEATTDQGWFPASEGVRIGDENQVTMALVDASDNSKNYWSQTDEQNFTLRFQARQDLPIGTRLTLHLPHYWLDAGAHASENADWSQITAVQSPDDWVIRAELGVEASVQDFEFFGTRPSGTGATAFDLAWAALDEGGTAKSHLIFRGLGSTESVAAPFTRVVSVAIPKILHSGTTTEWSVTFANPHPGPSAQLPDGSCLNCLILTKLTITPPSNEDLFQDATDGWTVTDHKLQWTGSLTLLADQAHEFRFDVTTKPLTSGTPFTPNSTIYYPDNNFARTLSQFRDHGQLTGRAFPNNATIPGYPPTSGSHKICADVRIDGRAHLGCTNYTTSHLPAVKHLASDIQKGLARSTLTVLEGMYTSPGKTITVTADFSKLVEGIGSSPDFQGSRNTTITIHYPWTKKNSTTHEWPKLATNKDLANNHSATFQIPRGAPYGSYVIVAEKDLDLTGGASVDQTARLASWVTVGEDGPLTQPVSVYQVTLNAWLPDWG